MNKLSAVILFVFLITQIAFAQSYESIPENEYFSFTDNFNRDAAYIDVNKTGTGVKLDDNWSSKSTGSMDGDGTTGVTTFGFDGENLVVCLYKQDTYPKISSNQVKKMAGINWTAEHSKLSSSFVITTTVKKSIGHNMWGIRFMQHNDEQNYYMLFFGGQYSYQLTTNAHLAWGLYKVQNGNVTILKEQLDSSYIGTAGDAKLKLKYNNGKISFNLDYNGVEDFYSGEYLDTANPYILTGNDFTVQLVESNATSGKNPVYFKDFSISNDIPYITSGEPDNVVYYSPNSGILPDENGIIDLGKPVKIRRILYDGNNKNTDILVSEDNLTWYKLTDTSEFDNGSFINTISDSEFRYINASSVASQLIILSEIDEINCSYKDDSVKLYPRLGKVDCFSDTYNVLSTDNRNLVSISGNYVKACGIGTANVFVEKGDSKITIPVSYTDEFYRYSDNFNGYGTINYSGSNVQFNKSWRSKTASEGKMGYDNDASFGYNNNRIFVQARGLAAGDSNSRYPRWADTVPAVVWNENHNEITKNHVIKMKIQKTSGTETSGVRFMVHNNGKSYYALLFPGMYAYGGISDTDVGTSSWELVKCDAGQYTLLGRLVRENQTADNKGGYLGFGEGELVLSYVDGKIEWSMDVTRNSETFTWSGEYKDENPFNISAGDMGVWLMSGLYSGADTTRGTYFDDVEIASYVPYITVDEPKNVVYKQIKTQYNSETGVYKLDDASSIRRVLVDGNVSVYFSENGTDWLYFDDLQSGSTLNSIYPEKFKYVKTVGNGIVKVLGNVENNTVKIYPNETLTLHPYVNGTECTDTLITEETECVEVSGTTIKGISPIRNADLLLTFDGVSDSINLSVELIEPEYNMSVSDDIVTVVLKSDKLENIQSKVALIYFNCDHSIKDMKIFDCDFNNGTETISAQNKFGDEVYARVMVWKTLESQISLTKAITLK